MRCLRALAAAAWFVVGLLWVRREAPEIWVMSFVISSVYVALLVQAWRDA